MKAFSSHIQVNTVDTQTSEIAGSWFYMSPSSSSSSSSSSCKVSEARLNLMRCCNRTDVPQHCTKGYTHLGMQLSVSFIFFKTVKVCVCVCKYIYPMLELETTYNTTLEFTWWSTNEATSYSYRTLHCLQHFNFQLMHTTLKNVELLKHFKIRKTAPACFGLQGNHHQGATVST